MPRERLWTRHLREEARRRRRHRLHCYPERRPAPQFVLPQATCPHTHTMQPGLWNRPPDTTTICCHCGAEWPQGTPHE